MPFPLSYRGKLEAWIGDDGLDRSNYQSLFVGKLADELRGMGRQDVYVLEARRALDKGSPQLFFPEGDLVTFGIRTQQKFVFWRQQGLSGKYGLDGLAKGEVEIELRDEILIVSYYLNRKLPFVLFSAALLGILGLWIAVNKSPVSNWSAAGLILIAWLFLLGPAYVNDLVVFRKLIKIVVKSVRDDIALNKSLSTSGF